MEIRARYVLIGAFTFLAILAGFGFVYWLNNAGGLSQRQAYLIHYEKTVSGLLKGSAVLFNGIRVGEVTRLELDPARPEQIAVSVAIESTVPVRQDTRATIEFQGLTGAPVVALFGGSASAPLVSSAGNTPPLLIAERNAGQSLGETARATLRHIDGVVLDNAEALRSAISGISAFSAALARNSDKVDGIVAGVERMTGGGQKVPPRVYELSAVRRFADPGPAPTGQVILPEPTGLGTFDTDRILVRGGEGQKPSLDNAQWPDVLPKLVQARLIQSFESAGLLRIFGRAPEGVTADHQMLVDVRSFHGMMGPAPSGEVEIAAKVVRADGKIQDARIFRFSEPAKAADAAAISAAIDTAFGKAVGEMVPWAFAAMK